MPLKPMEQLRIRNRKTGKHKRVVLTGPPWAELGDEVWIDGEVWVVEMTEMTEGMAWSDNPEGIRSTPPLPGEVRR